MRINEKKKSIAKNKAKLSEYITQLLMLKKLIYRNKTTLFPVPEFNKISLPFIALYPSIFSIRIQKFFRNKNANFTISI